MKPQYCSQGHSNSVDSRFCRFCGESLTGGSSQATVGELLGWRYRVISELAQGGFGRTYLVQDTHRFDEPCVLKEFAPQVQGQEALRKAEELFAREAGILYQLQHPQIPRFRELFRAGWQGRERLFLVQDYVEGQTYQELLHDRQNQGEGFTEAEATELLFQLLPVLDYIHTAGVIHRDISPDNLIRRSADGLPVLIDFGGVKQVAARAISESSSARSAGRAATMTRLGKLGYAPPEQLEQGEVSPHSDLYALAVTVLVLLTGKEPQDLFFSNGGLNHRAWQQAVSLHPTLTKALDRMLAPYPAKRYQSAQEVLQVLANQRKTLANSQRSAAAPKVSVPVFVPDPAQSATSVSKTVAVGRSRAKTQAQAVSRSPAIAPSLPWKEITALVKWLVLGSMIVGGWWVGVKWLGPALKAKLPEITHSMVRPPTSRSTLPKPQAPEFSKPEQTRKQKLAQHLQQLGIEDNFLVGLVNEVFYAKYPELVGQTLGTGSADANLRAEWDQIALKLADRLQPLSSSARLRLGQYSEADLRDRQNVLNQLHLSSRAANDLTDAQFFHLFPEQSRTDDLINQPIGQVWQAIAADQLKSLQSGETLKQVQFPTDNFSHRLSGTLKPGEAKVFLAHFSQNQAVRLQLQVPGQSVRLSLYPPSSRSPALLEDSQETTWSGKLKETGLYEITLASDTNQSISYAIDLAAADGFASP